MLMFECEVKQWKPAGVNSVGRRPVVEIANDCNGGIQLGGIHKQVDVARETPAGIPINALSQKRALQRSGPDSCTRKRGHDSIANEHEEDRVWMCGSH